MKRFLSFVFILLLSALPLMAAKTTNNYVIPTSDDFGSAGSAWQYDKYDSLLTILAGILSSTKNYDGVNVARVDADTLASLGTIAGNPTADSLVVSKILSVTGRITVDSIQSLDVLAGNPTADSLVVSKILNVTGLITCDTLQTLDVLAGNPTADSLVVSKIMNVTGRITCDSLQSLDVLAGNPTADSLVVSKILSVTGLVSTDTIQGLAVVAGNPVIDSIQGADVISGNPTIDSINCSANLVVGASGTAITKIEMINATSDSLCITTALGRGCIACDQSP